MREDPSFVSKTPFSFLKYSFSLSTVTEYKLEQSQKIPVPKVETYFPIITELKKVQSLNAYSLIVMTESGIVTVVMEVYPNEDLPIIVTESGIITEVSDVQR